MQDSPRPIFRLLVSVANELTLGGKDENGNYIPGTWDMVEQLTDSGLLSRGEYMRLAFKSYLDEYVLKFTDSDGNTTGPKWVRGEGFVVDMSKPPVNDDV